ncbi:MAG TPA: magnesium/cobalt transporter CorA [Cytophagales bacterium]|nr:magnesium/cobalt transporter CorA [Cytophagales bacterium]
MITAYYKKDGKILKTGGQSAFDNIPLEALIWIDLNEPSEEEKDYVEEFTDVSLQTRQQVEEIEISSKYIEFEDIIIVNSHFLTEKDGVYLNEPVSFILKNKLLISYRSANLRPFADTVRRFKANYQAFQEGHHFLISLFESRIDFDADLLESISKDITDIGRSLSVENSLDKKLLLKINSYQEITMIIRENIIDKQRVISSLLKSELFPSYYQSKLRIIIKDIGSLLDHSAFGFERLEYLQNTFLGLIDIEQNKIIKIFTLVSVIFMPPTLIASIYGMNFTVLPEFGWKLGYPFAILLMFLSSAVTLFLFKRKKWL